MTKAASIRIRNHRKSSSLSSSASLIHCGDVFWIWKSRLRMRRNKTFLNDAAADHHGRRRSEASASTAKKATTRPPLLVFVLLFFMLTFLVDAMGDDDLLIIEHEEEEVVDPPDNEMYSAKIWTTHLHPTAALEMERERRRFLKMDDDDDDDDQQHWPDYYDQWFSSAATDEDDRHHHRSAVYATIPDRDDPAHRHNRRLHDFYAHRHLSRYEQHYRRSRGLHLPLDWNGHYDDVFFALFHNDHDKKHHKMSATTSHSASPSPYSSNTSSTSTFTNHSSANGRRFVEEFSPPAGAASSSMMGGQYNNYQAVPLLQGYGTHFSIVWVGTPTPQRKTVIVDTGSHYTAFPCSGCKSCGAPHHTDPYFRPEKSDTFHQLQCSECQDGVVCDDGKCKFTQAYTEGSSWEAIQVKDRFYCGGTDVLDSVNPNDQKYAIDFMFGCQASMTGLFITQLADGIMGMSAHPATLPKKLYDERKIEHNLFALCYRRELGTSKRGVTAGSMTFGGVSNNLDSSPMVYAKNIAKIGWFTVFVKNIYVRTTGGQSAKSIDPVHETIQVRVNVKTLNSGKGVIVDSGTTDTYLNKRVAKEFTRAWKRATGMPYSHTPMVLTKEQLQSLPTILIQCQAYSLDNDPSIEDYDSIPGYAGRLDPSSPKDLLIAIPATSYMDYSPITKRYMSRLYFTESVGGVLGSNTMQGHNVLFDWQQGRIGFAESACTYDKQEVPEVAQDSGFATDCQLGPPILTRPCIDTVDRRMCKLSPTGIALLGKEMWTATVESPGNDAGISCVEAASEIGKRRSSEFDDPIVSCDGHGLCQEERPCQLTCAQAKKAAEVEPLSYIPDGHLSSCGGTAEWSACDYGCMQTKIESTVFSDGVCHEISRQSRPCHIGACSRSDPCRVPFIVHVVLAFRDGSVSNWSRSAEEIVAAALVGAANQDLDDQLFTIGDVNVVMALPWYQEENDSDQNDRKLGIKVVVEISMFNPLADAANKTLDVDDPDESFAEAQLNAMMRNITDILRGRNRRVTCVQEELYPLAKRALQAKETMEQEGFMVSLIDHLKVTGDRYDRSAFGPIQSSTYDPSSSRLISVWTIRTGIEEDINYFGPAQPFTAKLISFLQNSILLSAAFFIVMALWSCTLSLHEYATGRRYQRNTYFFPAAPSLLRGSRRYVRVENLEDPYELEDDIIMGPSGDLELTTSAHQEQPGSEKFRITTPKKRPKRSNSSF